MTVMMRRYNVTIKVGVAYNDKNIYEYREYIIYCTTTVGLQKGLGEEVVRVL